MLSPQPLTRALRLSTLIALVLIPAWSGHLLAQDKAASLPITKPLPFNQTISGKLRGKGEQVVYTLDIPAGQDVIIAYHADKMIFGHYCMLVNDAQPDSDHCSHYGGSGDDGPSGSYDLIPSNGQSVQHTTETLVRPRDGSTSYEITAYVITPQTIKLGESMSNIPPSSQADYQLYALEADPKVPFTVEIEDETADGSFLWVAYKPFTDENFPNVEKQMLMPQYLDWASGTTGVNDLELYYLGGRTFRVLAVASKPYNLYANDMKHTSLDENHAVNITVNYRQPLLVTQLNIQPGETAQIAFDVTAGKGAIVEVYEQGSLFSNGLALGWTSDDNPTFTLADTIQRTAVKALYVVVQLPYTYTRDGVNVAVIWQRVTPTEGS